jgi:hypothetical protein
MAILNTIGIVLIKTLVGMLTALLSETFLKQAIIECLQMLVDRTSNEWDNHLLEKAKEVWK